MTLLPDGSVTTLVTGPSGIPTVLVRQPRLYEAHIGPSAAYKAPFACYVPHTARHPESVAAAPANATWIDVGMSPVAYYAALHDWWGAGETFMVLEHDVTCRADVLETFDACPEPWCVYPYNFCHDPCKEAWRNMLGCTRFRAELLAAVPDAVTSIPRDGWDWHNLCDGLGDNLRTAGYSHHWHSPPVLHHQRTANED